MANKSEVIQLFNTGEFLDYSLPVREEVGNHLASGDRVRITVTSARGDTLWDGRFELDVQVGDVSGVHAVDGAADESELDISWADFLRGIAEAQVTGIALSEVGTGGTHGEDYDRWLNYEIQTALDNE